jgi:hypothetical protein
VARKFAARVVAWKDHKEEIRLQLILGRDCGKEILPLMRRSALLVEAVPVAEDVSALAAAGLEALDYLESGKAALRDWRAKQQPLLDRYARPRVELIIAITPAIRQLVEGAQSKVTHVAGMERATCLCSQKVISKVLASTSSPPVTAVRVSRSPSQRAAMGTPKNVTR